MSRERARQEETVELLTRVASLYYVDNLTQSEIATRIGVSRIKVVRLLQKAREIGIVEIRIQNPASLNTSLETALIQRFGLQQVLLVSDQGSVVSQRQMIAQAAAAQLDRLVQSGDTIAVGMGRNVGSVPEAIHHVSRRDCLFITAIGGSPLVGQPINSADICRCLAECYGGSSECLYAPAYVESPQMRETFLSHEEVKQTLARACSARFALVGIGDAMSDSAVVRMGCLSDTDMNRLREAGAVGDILGYFFDIQGRPIAPGMSDRVIGLSGDDLRRIPSVIGIVAEAEKTTALLGALRTGILNTLVTSVGNAQRLLEMTPTTERN